MFDKPFLGTRLSRETKIYASQKYWRIRQYWVTNLRRAQHAKGRLAIRLAPHHNRGRIIIGVKRHRYSPSASAHAVADACSNGTAGACGHSAASRSKAAININT